MTFELIKSWACFGGQQLVFRHPSATTKNDMDVAVYIPEHKAGEKLPVLIFLSGLTCTWENFTTKAGAQRYAAEHKVILVMPDTSPRGDDVPNDSSYDLGQGAGFYVDATQAPWNKNFQMFSYINMELLELIPELAPADMNRCGITGHSMGGHGALISAFRHPEKYKSVSAIAPICAPVQCPWGSKALSAYLGEDKGIWESYDASFLAGTTAWSAPILVDQGEADEFLAEQLKPDLLQQACKAANIPLSLRFHEGYDHSYYFITTVIGDHIRHHEEQLKS